MEMPSFRHRPASDWQEDQKIQSLWVNTEIDLDQLIHVLRLLGHEGLIKFIMRLTERVASEGFTRDLHEELDKIVTKWNNTATLNELVNGKEYNEETN